MRLDAERSSIYRIFTEYRADRPELQLEKRAAPALKVLLDATRRSTGLSVPIPCRECRHGPPTEPSGSDQSPWAAHGVTPRICQPLRRRTRAIRRTLPVKTWRLWPGRTISSGACSMSQT